jgi:amino-acid N-acetyltransferase
MIRKATIHDVRSIHALLQIYGSQGELLPRPLTRIYDHLRDFTVWVDEETDRVAGCCALQFCWEDLAEIRSLAVHPDRRGCRIGTLLTEWAITEAKIYHIQKVFTLTYRPGFFERFGFHRVDHADLPLKIWGDCLHCVKFPDCDEIAMMKILESDQE